LFYLSLLPWTAQGRQRSILQRKQETSARARPPKAAAPAAAAPEDDDLLPAAVINAVAARSRPAAAAAAKPRAKRAKKAAVAAPKPGDTVRRGAFFVSVLDGGDEAGGRDSAAGAALAFRQARLVDRHRRSAESLRTAARGVVVARDAAGGGRARERVVPQPRGKRRFEQHGGFALPDVPAAAPPPPAGGKTRGKRARRG